MNRYAALSVGVCLCWVAAAFGQYPVAAQENTQVDQPVYAPAPRPYSFRSAPNNYDPFQFNWWTGRWDYVPGPYGSPSVLPPRQAQPQYSVAPDTSPKYPGPPSSGSAVVATPAPPAAESAGNPNDSALWYTPPTQQEVQNAPKTVSVQGQIIGIRAIDLASEPQPHILLRLDTGKGTTATVDVGDQLKLARWLFNTRSDQPVNVTGKLGDIDGSPVVFAEKIGVGSQVVDVTAERSAARGQPQAAIPATTEPAEK